VADVALRRIVHMVSRRQNRLLKPLRGINWTVLIVGDVEYPVFRLRKINQIVLIVRGLKELFSFLFHVLG
jgi:hypothetical protein